MIQPAHGESWNTRWRCAHTRHGAGEQPWMSGVPTSPPSQNQQLHRPPSSGCQKRNAEKIQKRVRRSGLPRRGRSACYFFWYQKCGHWMTATRTASRRPQRFCTQRVAERYPSWARVLQVWIPSGGSVSNWRSSWKRSPARTASRKPLRCKFLEAGRVFWVNITKCLLLSCANSQASPFGHCQGQLGRMHVLHKPVKHFL